MILAGGMSVFGGLTTLFGVAEMPRISADVMQKIPLIGDHYKKEVAPEDSPF